MCENYVGECTLHLPGDPINRGEGAGKRLCMGGAGIYWTDKDGESHGKWLDFFCFSAVAAGQSAGNKGEVDSRVWSALPIGWSEVSSSCDEPFPNEVD